MAIASVRWISDYIIRIVYYRLFSSLEIDNYWSYSGAPKFLVQLIREKGWYLDDIDNSCLPKDYLSLPDTAINDPLPLMFQTGYLTIKGYDSDMQEFYWHIQIKR